MTREDKMPFRLMMEAGALMLRALQRGATEDDLRRMVEDVIREGREIDARRTAVVATEDGEIVTVVADGEVE